jgi:hypothetical protein
MKNKPRLTLDSHHDAVVVANAVREYCKARANGFHYAMCRAYDRGDKKEGDRLMTLRDDISRCRDKILERLDKIIDRLEGEIDRFAAAEDESGQLNGCPGDVGARDTF